METKTPTALTVAEKHAAAFEALAALISERKGAPVTAQELLDAALDANLASRRRMARSEIASHERNGRPEMAAASRRKLEAATLPDA